MTSLFIASLLCFGQADDLQCLPAQARAHAGRLLYESLQRQARAKLEERKASLEKLQTAEQIQAYQSGLRELLIEQLGGFPEKTPLNPQSVGTLNCEGYNIEKVIFESQPSHHVTANLYLPLSAPPFPAVLVSSGHSRTAKAADYNQRFGAALARHGIAALCYDPIGQGERSQFLSSTGELQYADTTREHFLLGVGSILVGRNTATYRIWDGIRAIDFLASRPDIDASRIGMTGCSGGGTLTSYVMALDPRVACAAPACYLTSLDRLIDTIGPQDAEQNIFRQIAIGADHADYVMLRAPLPTLISATTGDFFDIQGTWDTYRQANRIFTRLGFSERVAIAEADGDHGVQEQNLVAIVRWMRRWLLGKDDPVTVEKLIPRTEQELLCTPRGQVLLMPGERSVIDLNAALEVELQSKRNARWKTTPQKELLQGVRDMLHVRRLADLPRTTRQKAGKVSRDDYHIDKLLLESDHGVPLPALTWHPVSPNQDAYLYVHENGKTGDGEPNGPIEQLVRDGYVVVSVDLRGIGETAGDGQDEVNGDYRNFYLAYMLGESYVGMHTEDILAAAEFIAHYETKQPRNVHLVAVGRSCVAALHAAALEPELFATVTLKTPITSWSNVTRDTAPTGLLTHTVHGALTQCDLPDLLGTLDPQKVKIQDK